MHNLRSTFRLGHRIFLGHYSETMRCDTNNGRITKVRKECPSVSVSEIYFCSKSVSFHPFKEKGAKLLLPKLDGTFITYRCFPTCHWMAWQIAKVWIWWISVCWWICHLSLDEGGKARFVIDCPPAHPTRSTIAFINSSRLVFVSACSSVL